MTQRHLEGMLDGMARAFLAVRDFIEEHFELLCGIVVIAALTYCLSVWGLA